MLLKEAIPSPSASDTHGKPTGPKLPTRGASGKKGSAKKQQPQAQVTDSSPSSPLESLEKEDQATWEARRAMADSEMIRLERTHWLCQGYMRLILAAKKMGLVKENPPPFNDAAQGFEQRFASFHTMLVCPDPLSYNDFESSVNVEGIEAAALLKLAAESFEFASKVLELEIRAASATEELQLKSYPDSKSLRAIARSALRNKVCCGVLCQAEEESTASSLHLTFDFSTTPLWPALGATRSK